ncbi:MAG: trimethylamine methyltransferase family protein [Candidatus Humimicrobiaceae bacterium]
MRLKKAEILSSDEIKKIDIASREALTDIGILVHSDNVLKILADKGASVDFKSKIVKLGSRIIDECLASAPREIRIFDRDRQYFLNLGKKEKTFTASGHNAIYYYDDKKNERRPVTKKEVGNFALISDYLDNIDIVGVEAMPQDVFPKASIIHAVDAVINNTAKPVYFSPENVKETEALIKIMKIISGDGNASEKPTGICQISPISPLTWSKGTAEALALLANERFPVVILPEPYAGVTSPITMAGLVTVNNIENLAGVIFTQLISPGTPVIYGAGWTTFEMKKSAVLIAAVERNICTVAGSQLADYYNLPSHCIAFDTDSNIYDEQNGFEKIFNVLSTMQSGIDVVINAGMIGTGMSVSYEQLIVDNEIAKFTRKYIDGIEVSKDTIGLESLKSVGHHKDFMMEEHTFKYLRSKEYMDYDVSNRDIYDNWVKKGKPSITDNARELAQKIINEHKVKELGKEKKEKISQIIKDFENSFKM